MSETCGGCACHLNPPCSHCTGDCDCPHPVDCDCNRCLEENKREEIREYVESHRDQINKEAYEGNQSAMLILRAYHLNQANKNGRKTRIVYEAAVEAYRRLKEKNVSNS